MSDRSLVVGVSLACALALALLVSEIVQFASAQRPRQVRTLLVALPGLALSACGPWRAYDVNYVYYHVPHKTSLAAFCSAVVDAVQKTEHRLKTLMVTLVMQFSRQHQLELPLLFEAPRPCDALLVIPEGPQPQKLWVAPDSVPDNSENSTSVVTFSTGAAAVVLWPSAGMRLRVCGSRFTVVCAHAFKAWEF